MHIDEDQLPGGATAGIRDGSGESGTAAAGRISRGREPNPASAWASPLRLSNAERATLAEIGKRLGRKGLARVAQVAKPETILGWWRKLVAQKFDGSKHRSYPGRPRIDAEVDSLIVQIARENSGWGLRSDRRGTGQSRSRRFRPDSGKRASPSRKRSSARPEPNDGMEGLHRGTDGGIGRHGFLLR